jgi:hypothetical protein
MTDENHIQTDEQQEKKRAPQEWFGEAEAALERVTEAIREAWDASRDSRVSALEAAREALGQLGEAIDHGVAVAKERWAAQMSESPETTNTDGSSEEE